MTRIISLPKKIGEQLGRRADAATLREEVLRFEQPIQLDFSGVKVISFSFAEEFFGQLARQCGPDIFNSRIVLKNIRPDHLSLVQAAVDRHKYGKAA